MDARAKFCYLLKIIFPPKLVSSLTNQSQMVLILVAFVKEVMGSFAMVMPSSSIVPFAFGTWPWI